MFTIEGSALTHALTGGAHSMKIKTANGLTVATAVDEAHPSHLARNLERWVTESGPILFSGRLYGAGVCGVRY